MKGSNYTRGKSTAVNHWKSRTSMSFRLSGDLPPSQEVTHLLGIAPTFERRKGEPIPPGRRKQPIDVWSLALINRSEWEDGLPLSEATARVADILRRLTPGLAQLDRRVIEEAMGGFGIPVEIVAAAGAAQLQISVSVHILLEDDEDDGADEVDSGADGNVARPLV
jgi:hypothetical protein